MHLKFVQLLNTGIFVKYSASFNEKLLIYECYTQPIGGSANASSCARNKQ